MANVGPSQNTQDISFAVNMMSQFVPSLCIRHWGLNFMMHKSTLDQGLLCEDNGNALWDIQM